MNAQTEPKNSRTLLGGIILLLTALIWGSAFVAQSVGMEHVGPFTFNAIRSLIAAGAIGLFAVLRGAVTRMRGSASEESREEIRKKRDMLLLGGLVCGSALFLASSLQQCGLLYTTVAKSGFLTSLYIIEVPIAGIFLKKKVGLPVWISVGIALVGMYLLCMDGSLVLSKGDLLIFLCSLAFTLQILAVDYFAAHVDPVKLSMMQFLVTGILSVFGMLFEAPSLDGILEAAPSILYAAIFSSGVAYTLQIVGQKMVRPAEASILMSFESVFALLSGAVILSEIPTAREWVGSALMFGAILLSEIPFERLRSSPNPSRGEKNQDENNENKKKQVRKKSCRYE